MDPRIPYLACLVGAAALYVLTRPGRQSFKSVAAILGLGLLAWLLVETDRFVGPVRGSSAEIERPEIFFTIFSLIAIASAVRMITHSRPVYSALYFIMVVLSSAALFLLLEAEFMAFALVIVYAGAILITYMFVLMLAHQAPSSDDPHAAAEYDIVPREPVAAVAVGFVMLALFSHMVFGGAGKLPQAPSQQQALTKSWSQLEMMRPALADAVAELSAGSELYEPPQLQVRDGIAHVAVITPDLSDFTWEPLPDKYMPNNVQLVGLDLVWKFPVSLELAGIILLMAMFGAVVLARKQIEMGEDEVREAAGMRRLALHADEPDHREPKLGPGAAS